MAMPILAPTSYPARTAESIDSLEQSLRLRQGEGSEHHVQGRVAAGLAVAVLELVGGGRRAVEAGERCRNGIRRAKDR